MENKNKIALPWVGSGGNVFQDFNLPGAQILLLKSAAATELQRAIRERKLTRKRAGDLMGIPAVKVSRIVCGLWKGYSRDRLFTCLHRRDVAVLVLVKPKYSTPEKTRGGSA